MKYIMAFDGGGTKTRMVVADKKGNVLFDQLSTGSNIVSSGDSEFDKVIRSLFDTAKKELNIKNDDIEFIFLGLSGADLEDDFKRLNGACKRIFTDIPFKVDNDAWIILRSGLSTPFGAVAIAGTGTNSAAINSLGERAILRALSYMLGTYGGGLDIAREALHYAYRADELTYKETILRTEIPKLFNKKTMDDILPLFYPKRVIDKVQFGSITPLVYECALQGDEVAIEILEEIGKHIALQTIGVIKQVGIQDLEVPIVVGGRVFSSKLKFFLDSFTKHIKQHAPKATIVFPIYPPVIGAYFSALDELNINQSQEIENNIVESCDCDA